MEHFPRVFGAGLCALFIPWLGLHGESPALPASANNDPLLQAAQTLPESVVLMVVFEAYALAKEDARAVMEAEHSSGDRYRNVLELQRSGRAQLEILTALPTKSGQRAINQSNDEVRFPTEFSPGIHRGDFSIPTAWETRNVGDALEMEPTFDPGQGYCDINLVPQRVTFGGFRDLPGTSDDAPVGQPKFTSQKIVTSTSLKPGQIHFLGTMTPPAGSASSRGREASEIWLTFLHVHPISITSARQEMKPFEKSPDGFAIDLEFSFYSLERTAARDLLASFPKLDSSWDRLAELLQENKARFEHIVSIKSRSGQRATIDESGEIRFGTEYSASTAQTGRETKTHTVSDAPPSPPKDEKTPSQPQNPPAAKQETTTFERDFPNPNGSAGSFTAFEMRNTGVSVEVEATTGPDGAIVDINTVVKREAFLGNLKVTGVAEHYQAQPLIECRKITTSVTTVLGSHCLVGTLSDPGANGVNDRVDTGRTWLVFLRVIPSEM